MCPRVRLSAMQSFEAADEWFGSDRLGGRAGPGRPRAWLYSCDRGLKTAQSLVRKAIGCATLEDLSIDERARLWPAAAVLTPEHLRNCRVFPDRRALLDLVPRGGECAEVGVWKGEFSRVILEATQPRTLHLIDFAKETIDLVDGLFAAEIASGRVRTHHSLSVDAINSLPPASLDWIYIDADHAYEGVNADLEAARTRMKPGGLIAMNDYVYFGPLDFAKYGVVEAVNQFCLDYRYEFIGMALHPRMYMDVLLKPMPEPVSAPA